jgi:hypothetical protein
LIDTDLGATMPPVAAWRGTRLPQGLRAADVEAVLNGCDRSRSEAELDEEVQAYFDIQVERRIAQGLTREEAQRSARLTSSQR